MRFAGPRLPAGLLLDRDWNSDPRRGEIVRSDACISPISAPHWCHAESLDWCSSRPLLAFPRSLAAHKLCARLAFLRAAIRHGLINTAAGTNDCIFCSELLQELRKQGILSVAGPSITELNLRKCWRRCYAGLRVSARYIPDRGRTSISAEAGPQFSPMKHLRKTNSKFGKLRLKC